MNESELLFSSILNCDRISLCLNKESVLDKDCAELASSVLKRRINGEPIQYILGKTEFMGLEFKVGPGVLIPRPETEILIETAIRYVTMSVRKPPRRGQSQCASLPEGGNVTKILDIGTGSGNIAISLAIFFRKAKIDALDISESALDVAKENAKLNNVDINFIHGDLFLNDNLTPDTYDLIISNPPYIPTAEIEKLQPEIQYEPRIALDGGIDGLDFYRRIIASSLQYLKTGGLLITEMGYNQRRPLKNIFQKCEDFEIIEVIKDYNNIARVMVARRKR